MEGKFYPYVRTFTVDRRKSAKILKVFDELKRRVERLLRESPK
jgi:hypothetical protein